MISESEYPLAGCSCLSCDIARRKGVQEWIEPEPEEPITLTWLRNQEAIERAYLKKQRKEKA